jgi:hypothetical protein
MPVKRNLLKVVLTIGISYSLFNLLMYYLISLSIYAVLIYSFVLFLISVFLFFRARKTIHRNKETIFSIMSSVALFESVFGAMEFLGLIHFSTFVSIFFLMFFVFLFLKDSEFIIRFFDFNLVMLMFTKFVLSFEFGEFTLPSIIVGAVIAAIIIYQLFISTESYEREMFLEASFAYMLVIISEAIIRIVLRI